MSPTFSKLKWPSSQATMTSDFIACAPKQLADCKEFVALASLEPGAHAVKIRPAKTNDTLRDLTSMLTPKGYCLDRPKRKLPRLVIRHQNDTKRVEIFSLD